MARMIPVEPANQDGLSNAERVLFDELRRQLPDDYIVFHGVRFLADRQRSYSTDREIDFLIVHPARTGVVAEVKGGGIRVDPETGVWASVDRHGTPHQIKNPFDQARTNMYDLIDELGHHPQTRGHRYAFNWQVMLPDVSGIRHQTGIEAPDDTLLESTDLHALQTAIERAARPLPKHQSLSNQAMRALINAIAPTVAAAPEGLGYHLLTSERKLIELTRTQAQLLDFLEQQPRAGIAGCCGSGKTMLALEKTRRLAEQGRRVLLTCFNANLADWLRTQLDLGGPSEWGNVVCHHYHGLVRQLCAETGVEIPPEPPEREAQRRYYTDIFPECLDQAIDRLPDDDRFDAVIADEGQDFGELWWWTLDSLLKEPKTGTFYIFYDNNQRIYGQSGDMPVPENPYPLNRNCRNTDQIHRMVRPFYQGDGAFQAAGIEGREPEIVPIGSGDGVDELRKVLHRLVNEERILERDITILSPVTSRGGSALEDGMKLGNFTLRRTIESPGEREIRLSTIHSFKGLESPVVIMTELDRLTGRDRTFRDGLLYVGLSRARSHLIVLGDLPENRE